MFEGLPELLLKSFTLVWVIETAIIWAIRRIRNAVRGE